MISSQRKKTPHPYSLPLPSYIDRFERCPPLASILRLVPLKCYPQENPRWPSVILSDPQWYIGVFTNQTWFWSLFPTLMPRRSRHRRGFARVGVMPAVLRQGWQSCPGTCDPFTVYGVVSGRKQTFYGCLPPARMLNCVTLRGMTPSSVADPGA
jgi:hypothetical protein